MINYYFLSIGLYCFSLMVFMLRVLANKKQINSKESKEKWFIYVRLIVASFIPVVNLIIVIWNIYMCILADNEKFIKYMNE